MKLWEPSAMTLKMERWRFACSLGQLRFQAELVFVFIRFCVALLDCWIDSPRRGYVKVTQLETLIRNFVIKSLLVTIYIDWFLFLPSLVLNSKHPQEVESQRKQTEPCSRWDWKSGTLSRLPFFPIAHCSGNREILGRPFFFLSSRMEKESEAQFR